MEQVDQRQQKTCESLRVFLFGAEATLLGTSEIFVPAEEGIRTVRDLRSWLAGRYTELRPLISQIRVAVNHRFAADDTPLGPNDEIALIGKVSGG
ncbi:MoaD/ThiS family protein [Thermogutta sp.]|uniref:MoaD/ThiS family protein n=1 Tax=Thermogutta sp. TaxID=1962930 RepID=UPI003C7E85B9